MALAYAILFDLEVDGLGRVRKIRTRRTTEQYLEQNVNNAISGVACWSWNQAQVPHWGLGIGHEDALYVPYDAPYYRTGAR